MADLISQRDESSTSACEIISQDHANGSRNGVIDTDSLNSNNSMNHNENGMVSSVSSSQGYEDRIKKLKAKEFADYESKKEQLLLSQMKADEARKRRERERKQKIEENRRREIERRKQVEARRIDMDKAKLDKLERLIEKVNSNRDFSSHRAVNLMSASCYGSWSRPTSARSSDSSQRPTVAFGSSVPREGCTYNDQVTLRRQRLLEERLTRFINSRHKGCLMGSRDHEMQYLISVHEEQRSRSQNHTQCRGPRSRSANAHFMRATKASMMRAVSSKAGDVHSASSMRSVSTACLAGQRVYEKPRNLTSAFSSCSLKNLTASDDSSSVRSSSKIIPIAPDSRLVAHTVASMARIRSLSTVENALTTVVIKKPHIKPSATRPVKTKPVLTVNKTSASSNKSGDNSVVSESAESFLGAKEDSGLALSISESKNAADEDLKAPSETSQMFLKQSPNTKNTSPSIPDDSLDVHVIETKDKTKSRDSIPTLFNESKEKKSQYLEDLTPNTIPADNKRSDVPPADVIPFVPIPMTKITETEEENLLTVLDQSEERKPNVDTNTGPTIDRKASIAIRLNAESNSSGEGGNLSGDALAIYKARIEEQRRIAREKLETEQKIQKEKELEEQRKKAELRAEQMRRAQARAEEDQKKEKERKRIEFEAQEKLRIEKEQAEEEERRLRKEKLLNIKRKVGLQGNVEENAPIELNLSSKITPQSSPLKTYTTEQNETVPAQSEIPIQDSGTCETPKFQSALLQRMLSKNRLNTLNNNISTEDLRKKEPENNLQEIPDSTNGHSTNNGEIQN